VSKCIAKCPCKASEKAAAIYQILLVWARSATSDAKVRDASMHAVGSLPALRFVLTMLAEVQLDYYNRGSGEAARSPVHHDSDRSFATYHRSWIGIEKSRGASASG
jgi:hypothetical protein